jgi:hypothetical protein
VLPPLSSSSRPWWLSLAALITAENDQSGASAQLDQPVVGGTIDLRGGDVDGSDVGAHRVFCGLKYRFGGFTLGSNLGGAEASDRVGRIVTQRGFRVHDPQ